MQNSTPAHPPAAADRSYGLMAIACVRHILRNWVDRGAFPYEVAVAGLEAFPEGFREEHLESTMEWLTDASGHPGCVEVQPIAPDS